MSSLILFVIGCAIVYVASIEAALGAVARRPDRLTVERNPKNALLATHLKDPLRLYVVMRLLRGFLFASGAVVLARLIGVRTPQAIGALLLAIVLFVMISEQVLPLVLVRRNGSRTLEFLLPSFDVVFRVVRPVATGMLRLVHLLLDRFEMRSGVGAVTELSETLAETSGQKTASDQIEERRLLQSVVDFGGTLVREVMTPRPDIVAIAHDATVAEFRELFSEKEYSRIPVYEETLDDILGLVFAKDLVTLDGAQDTTRVVSQLLRPAHVVPEDKRVADLLRELQVKRVQTAIVVDEYGGTAGLVTIEDLLEEIVGEIRDEYDKESDPIVDEGGGVFVLLATVNVGDMAEHLGVTVERDGFETVGGYLLTRLDRVPAAGEMVEIDDLIIEVLEAEGRRVRKVRVQRRA